MTMGVREDRQEALFVTADELPKSQGHPFYVKLNALLREAGFDAWIEGRCEACYDRDTKAGRPSVPPGVYFRMLLVGYFEGIGSQRGIAWRCSDSLSIRDFLAVPPGKQSPDHSSLSKIRDRLPLQLHLDVFTRIFAAGR